MHEEGKKCNCRHHKVIPLLIVVFGVVFLLQAMGKLTPEYVSIVWPVLVIAGGGTKLFSGYCTCC